MKVATVSKSQIKLRVTAAQQLKNGQRVGERWAMHLLEAEIWSRVGEQILKHRLAIQAYFMKLQGKMIGVLIENDFFDVIEGLVNRANGAIRAAKRL